MMNHYERERFAQTHRQHFLREAEHERRLSQLPRSSRRFPSTPCDSSCPGKPCVCGCNRASKSAPSSHVNSAETCGPIALCTRLAHPVRNRLFYS